MLRKMLASAAIPLLAACTPARQVASPSPSSSTVATAGTATPSASGNPALVRREMPGEDPGPPFYARVGMQVLESDGYVAIPFYRPPELVPAGFNLLTFYDPPGPKGAGAFAAPLLVSGFTVTEAGAPPGTFPRLVEMTGERVPIWFVPSTAFHAAVRDSTLTIGELRGLSPLVGIASGYRESLHPRDEDHQITIEAAGTMADGRAFTLHIEHVGVELRRMRIAFR